MVQAIAAVAVAAALFGLHQVVFMLNAPSMAVPSALWPLSGVAFAAAWLLRLRVVAPAVWLSSYLAFGLSMDAWVETLVGASVNALECVVAVLVLRQVHVKQHLFTEVRSTLLWLLIATLLAPSVSAFLLTFTEIATGELRGLGPALIFWLSLLVSNMVGAATFAPPILLAAQHRKLRHQWRRAAECVVLGAVTIGLAWLIFGDRDVVLPFPKHSLVLLALPSALYATFRLGPLTLAFVILVYVFGAYVGTGFSNGPFAAYSERQQLFAAGVFLAVLSATPLLVMALLVERRKNAEALSQALNRERLYRSELDHRVRNNFGNILALIDLSAQSAKDLQHFADAIGDRVRTMNAAHNLLAQHPHQPIELADLVVKLAPDEASHRIRVSGETCRVHPSRVRAIAMVLAELFTNARRHGALTHTGASIEVSWSRVQDEPAGWRLSWRERGCPSPTEPPGEGTGRKLVNGFARSELQGDAEWDFGDDGLNFTLTFRADARPTTQIPGYANTRRTPAPGSTTRIVSP